MIVIIVDIDIDVKIEEPERRGERGAGTWI